MKNLITELSSEPKKIIYTEWCVLQDYLLDDLDEEDIDEFGEEDLKDIYELNAKGIEQYQRQPGERKKEGLISFSVTETDRQMIFGFLSKELRRVDHIDEVTVDDMARSVTVSIQDGKIVRINDGRCIYIGDCLMRIFDLKRLEREYELLNHVTELKINIWQREHIGEKLPKDLLAEQKACVQFNENLENIRRITYKSLTQKERKTE